MDEQRAIMASLRAKEVKTWKANDLFTISEAIRVYFELSREFELAFKSTVNINQALFPLYDAIKESVAPDRPPGFLESNLVIGLIVLKDWKELEHLRALP